MNLWYWFTALGGVVFLCWIKTHCDSPLPSLGKRGQAETILFDPLVKPSSHFLLLLLASGFLSWYLCIICLLSIWSCYLILSQYYHMHQLPSPSISSLISTFDLHLILWKVFLYCLLFIFQEFPGLFLCTVCWYFWQGQRHFWPSTRNTRGGRYRESPPPESHPANSKSPFNSRIFCFICFKWASLHLICSAFCELPYGISGKLVKMYLSSHKSYIKMSNT